MQYAVTTPEEYLKVLESDWKKEKLLEIRSILLNQKPQLIEGIEYKMLSYGLGGEIIFNLNAQRNYVSLYVGNIDKVDNSKALLMGIDRGKGCIRIKKSTIIAETRIEEFIKTAMDHWQKGGDTNC